MNLANVHMKIENKKLKEDIRREAEKQIEKISTEKTFLALTELFFLALHDKHGWGKKRLLKLFDDYYHMLEALQDNKWLCMNDVRQTLKKEVDIDVEQLYRQRDRAE